MKTNTMTKRPSVVAAMMGGMAALVLASCGDHSETGTSPEEVGETIDNALKDAADQRPAEPIQDAAEDLQDSIEDSADNLDDANINDGLKKIGTGLKEVAREVATETGETIRRVGEKIEEKADQAERGE